MTNYIFVFFGFFVLFSVLRFTGVVECVLCYLPLPANCAPTTCKIGAPGKGKGKGKGNSLQTNETNV